MENLALKIRLSVLWLFTEVAYLAGVAMFFMEPGTIKEVMSRVVKGVHIGPEWLLFAAILNLVPLVMAVLALTLRDSANHWANIILGIFFTGLDLFYLIQNLAQPSAHATLMWVSIVVAPALIVWYAWKWPKLEV